MLDLLSSIVVHPTLRHLLRLPVFSSDNGSAGGDETTLASLIAKLREITKIYQKTAKLVDNYEEIVILLMVYGFV
jgi:hypothetical protein